jgi:hypothetical protein
MCGEKNGSKCIHTSSFECSSVYFNRVHNQSFLYLRLSRAGDAHRPVLDTGVTNRVEGFQGNPRVGSGCISKSTFQSSSDNTCRIHNDKLDHLPASRT